MKLMLISIWLCCRQDWHQSGLGYQVWLHCSSTDLPIGLLPKFNRPAVLHDNNDKKNKALVNRQSHAYVDVDTHDNIPFLSTGST